MKACLAFLRTAESKFNLANFMKVNLYTSLGAVKMGLDILMDDEKVKVEKIMGHGGFFKTKGVGQRYLAAAVGAPVTVMDTASEVVQGELHFWPHIWQIKKTEKSWKISWITESLKNYQERRLNLQKKRLMDLMHLWIIIKPDLKLKRVQLNI